VDLQSNQRILSNKGGNNRGIVAGKADTMNLSTGVNISTGVNKASTFSSMK
jgi:hypothetical protein